MSRADYRKWVAQDQGNFRLVPTCITSFFLVSVKCDHVEGAGQVPGTA